MMKVAKKATGIKVANTNEAKNTEMKTNYVSDEEVRKVIKEKWGEEVYVAAIDAEFIENIIAQEDAASSTTSSGGRRKRGRVKVTTQVAIAFGASVQPFTNITPNVSKIARNNSGFWVSSFQKYVNDKSILSLPYSSSFSLSVLITETIAAFT